LRACQCNGCQQPTQVSQQAQEGTNRVLRQEVWLAGGPCPGMTSRNSPAPLTRNGAWLNPRAGACARGGHPRCRVQQPRHERQSRDDRPVLLGLLHRRHAVGLHSALFCFLIMLSCAAHKKTDTLCGSVPSVVPVARAAALVGTEG
jgi:hypothetical protein